MGHGRRAPYQGAVTQSLHFALPAWHVPGVKMNHPPAYRPAITCYIPGGPGLDRQLFAQFADQRVGLAFPGLNFTAGKFPQPGLIAMGWTLGQQNFPVALQNGGDHINFFHDELTICPGEPGRGIKI